MASISGSKSTESTMIAMPFTCASMPLVALFCISNSRYSEYSPLSLYANYCSVSIQFDRKCPACLTFAFFLVQISSVVNKTL